MNDCKCIPGQHNINSYSLCVDVSIDVPDLLDLSALRGQGLQPGEEELPEAAALEPEQPGNLFPLSFSMELSIRLVTGTTFRHQHVTRDESSI